MTRETLSTLLTMYPYFVYCNTAAAIEWLAQAFGFEKTQAFSAPAGSA